MIRQIAIVATIALFALVGCDNDDTPSAEPESTRTQPASPTLPALRLPGHSRSPAGKYGWQGGPGERALMHNVVGEGETSLTFAVGPDCFGASQEQQAVPVRVAGFDAKLVEPYEPPVPYGRPVGDEITRAHALVIGDRTLCVFLTWQPTTTDDRLERAKKVLDTIQAEPIGEDQIRVTFTLGGGWDTG